jgi:hypothetical protein
MKRLLLAVTALVLLSGGAYAQTSTSNSGSTATVNTTSGSQSSAQSNPRVNVIGNPIGNGASSSYSGAKSTSGSLSNSRSGAVGNVTNVYTGTSGTSGGGDGSTTGTGTTPGGSGSTTGTGTTGTGTTAGSSGGSDPNTTINYSGSYTVRNTPEVIPPNVMGGNPCAVGASGGISTPGFGLAMGATWADRACERRQQAALLFNMGEQKVALELMCQDDNIRAAMKVAARPCTADIPAQPPVTSAAPVMATTVATPAQPQVLRMAAKPARPEWCYTASAAEQRRHAVCDER